MDRRDDVYEGRPPRDIGRPRPDFVKLFRDGELECGRILDVGCGTGENALFLAENGCDITGVDIARRAIELAKEKAVTPQAMAMKPSTPIETIIFSAFSPFGPTISSAIDG